MFRKLETTSLIRALLPVVMANRHQLLMAKKKKKNDPTHCCSEGLFHYISTNAKYPRLENLHKRLIDHLHRMAQAI